MSVELAEGLIGSMHEGVLIFDQDARLVFGNRPRLRDHGDPALRVPTRSTGPTPRFLPVLRGRQQPGVGGPSDGRRVAHGQAGPSMMLGVAQARRHGVDRLQRRAHLPGGRARVPTA